VTKEPPAIEREVKLSAWPGFRMPPLDDAVAGLVAGASATRLLDTTYWDAADLRLVRSGITLRHRVGQGPVEGVWTLKLPRPSGRGLVERAEIDVRGGGDQPPPALVAVVRGMLRGALLTRVAHLQTRRMETELRSTSAELAASVADDEVSVLSAGDRVAARFRQLEVELAPGAPVDVADAVVERLRAAGAGEPDATPKLVRALGPRALAPADPPVPTMRGDPTIGEIAQAALAGAVRKLLNVDPTLRTAPDEAIVHEARVATRRMRADLRTFRDAFEPGWAHELTGELAWLGEALGRVRDLDVLGERLGAFVAQLDPADREPAAALVARLHPQRDAALAELVDVLDGDRYLSLLESLVRAATHPAFSELAGTLAREGGALLASTPWNKLRRSADAADAASSPEALHRVRIHAKRMRYAAEAVGRVVPAAARHAKELAALQDALGGVNDAVTAEGWLRATIAAGATTDEAVAAGELIAMEKEHARALRASWPTVWAKASGKKVRSWLRS
jgi:CHAD domain-containing protein